jgi:tetratricopeptide (TPR) repeat protein
MSKYNRKQRAPKEDEFVSFWGKVFQLVEPYLRAIGVTAATALVLVFVVWGATSWSESKAQKAAEQFGRAVKVYDAELLTGDEKPKLDEDNPIPRFKTEKERADAALAELDKLDKDFGSSDVAKNAQLVRAGILYDQGRFDDAAKAYDAALKHAPKDGAVAAVAREGAGLCDEARGKLDDALAKYKDMEPAGKSDFFRDRALVAQARVFVKKGDKKKAAELYRDALAKVPTTPLKDEIQAQLAALEGT